ncbi:MAG: UDP-N-acetylmuramate:L-alanyl-gamma-D-glutamyl-meso-diaminopimelate ligase [Acidobacteria bacterium]|nr:UDP-N-acetylmuramate:L-alanyl-gamma-D-glutamyl-meso-diaminopimelate ligase [Acidobacteriota bacterium]
MGRIFLRLMHYHLIGICGTAMASLAGMLQARGHRVTGSDESVYPPMSTMLESLGIPVMQGYKAEHLAPAPDFVIIGNAIPRGNLEVEETLNRKLRYRSQAETVKEEFIRGRRSLVVAGTHGKTTTTSIAAWVMDQGGLDPTFLVGGVVQNFDASFRVTESDFFLIEGDEYDTAYFDKGPKFLHYQAKTCILTSVEFDHADIYRDLPHYESSFRSLLTLMPQALGHLVVCSAYPNAVALASACKAKVTTYQAKEGAPSDYTPRALRFGPDGARFEVIEHKESRGEVLLTLSGAHNVENALGVYAAARGLGLSHEEIKAGFASFQGVKRRQEVRAEVGGVLVIDDFAHHPTAVRETISAIRARYPERRLWAVFEPRSNTSRRNIHQEEYAKSFPGAARVSLKVPEKHDKVPTGEELDVAKLVRDIEATGIEAEGDVSVEGLVQKVAAGAKSGDCILVMSNGAFGGFIEKLLAALHSRGPA